MGPSDPIADAIFSPGEDVSPSGSRDYYINLLKNLEPGVIEVFVHLSHDAVESQAIMVAHPEWDAAWRQRESDTISSPRLRKALEENHVVLIGRRENPKDNAAVASVAGPAEGWDRLVECQRLRKTVFLKGFTTHSGSVTLTPER